MSIKYISRICLCTIFFFSTCFLYGENLQSAGNISYVKNSVLSTGNWYKINIPSTGVYKLTYEDLKSMGLTNPANVKIYGYGGWTLDEDFRNGYVDDLPQISIWMSKDRASFGAGDYVLFYARGNIKWAYSNSLKEFVHTQNTYSTSSTYFVTESDDVTNLVQNSTPAATQTAETNAFVDYSLHEKDLLNLTESGRGFYGENLNASGSNTYTFTLSGITDDAARIRYGMVAKPVGGNGTLSVSVNNVNAASGTISDASSTDVIARRLENVFLNKLSENTSLKLAYSQASSSDRNVHLNFIRITYRRSLKPYGGVTLFRDTLITNGLKYNIAEATNNMMVFDVTDNTTIKKVDVSLAGTALSFVAPNTSIREYALVDLSKSIPKPEVVGKIENQNLHASEVADMVIIVQPYLQSYAEQLAQLHADESGLTSLIVNPEQIYNEFSAGNPDATAYRRFMKMFHDNEAENGAKPKYLLLFGDGVYDNRFVSSQWTSNQEKRGMLLTYQSNDESISVSGSYTTDDYFGFLDDNEGSSLGSAKLDIGIGRLPVRTESEAASVVRKIQRYMANEERGIWQNTIMFVADDAIGSHRTSSELSHIKFSNAYAETLKNNYPSIIIKKVYEDAFERVLEAKGARYPSAEKAMLDNIDKGTLVINYSGHGSTREWSHEYILTLPVIEAMSNTKLPLWITATCDFSRFDGIETSGGETALLNSKGGAIALFSTVREVYISDNDTMNTALIKHLFNEDDGKALRLGDIIRNAKTESTLASDDNKLRFLLLGDPALRLRYPDNACSVNLTEINSNPVSSSDITLNALSNVSIKGVITDTDGNTINDFNGTLESVIFDNEQALKTRGYFDPEKNPENIDTAFDYKDFTNTIFAGKTEVKNGEFELAFVIPKDILYTATNGKMSFYATNEDNSREGQGYFTNYVVNGTDPNAKYESEPPVIEEIYLNESSFKSGDETNTTPMFYAKIKDNTGINLSSAIGHNISLMVDGINSYDLTPSFVISGFTTAEGSVSYRLPELTEGKHSLLFKVWDVWNNSQTAQLDFKVVENYQPKIFDFKIAVNPARSNTRFVLTTNIPGSSAQINYQVFSMNGSLLWSYQESGTIANTSEYIYDWDLILNNGTKLKPGVYICRAGISIDGREENYKSQKLIVVQ